MVQVPVFREGMKPNVDWTAVERAAELTKKLPGFIEALGPLVEETEPPYGSAALDAYDTLFNASVNGVHPSWAGCHLATLSMKVLQEWHAGLTGVPGQKYEPFTLTVKIPG